MKSKPAVLIVLTLLTAAFIYELASGALENNERLLQLGALPDSSGLHGEYWRIISYSFLHFNLTHFLLNGALLWWTGGIVERRLGSLSTIGVYLAAVLLGGIAIVWWKSLHPTDSVTVGASAGVFSLLGCSLVLYYRPAARHFGQSARIRLYLWLIFAIGVVISFLPGVSFLGHLVGIVCGASAGAVLPIPKKINEDA